MKHAAAQALDRLEPLLGELRKHAQLKERSRGVFYRGGKAFLHFHEHGEELYADVRLADDFERFPVTSRTEGRAFLKKVSQVLA